MPKCRYGFTAVRITAPRALSVAQSLCRTLAEWGHLLTPSQLEPIYRYLSLTCKVADDAAAKAKHLHQLISRSGVLDLAAYRLYRDRDDCKPPPDPAQVDFWPAPNLPEQARLYGSGT